MAFFDLLDGNAARETEGLIFLGKEWFHVHIQ